MNAKSKDFLPVSTLPNLYNIVQWRYLQETNTGYFAYNDKNELELHGFRHISPDTKVAIYLVEDNDAILFDPDDKLPEDGYLLLDFWVLNNPDFIAFLASHDAINCLFVSVDHRWLQIPGVRITQIVDRTPKAY